MVSHLRRETSGKGVLVNARAAAHAQWARARDVTSLLERSSLSRSLVCACRGAQARERLGEIFLNRQTRLVEVFLLWPNSKACLNKTIGNLQ